MNTHYSTRYSAAPKDVKSYDTSWLRDEFLIDNLMESGKMNLVYTHYDRFIVGRAVSTNNPIKLETIDGLKVEYFLERRELGIINVGESGTLTVDGTPYTLEHKVAFRVWANSAKND